MQTIEARIERKTLRQIVYTLPAGKGHDDFLKALSKHFGIAEEPSRKLTEQYLDTFDWQLYKKNMTISRNGGRYVLMRFDREVLAEDHGTRKNAPFWWDLPMGSLREILQDTIGVRSLIPLLKVKKTSKKYRLLNKDRKTVLHLQIDFGEVESDRDIDGQLKPTISCTEIRGYQGAFDKLLTVVRKNKLMVVPNSEPFLARALVVTERQPMDYVSKFAVSLTPDLRVHEAVSEICLLLMQAMEINLPGVVKDLDSEFLHDFRIAVRRTRSLISQCKKVLPNEVVEGFNDEFRWLGEITGPVRDLDVYLLMREEYRSMLPGLLHFGLDAFFQDLELLRKKEIRIMLRELRSKRIQQLFSSWEQFLTSSPSKNWKGAEKNCRKVAVKVIHKRFQRILKDGQLIDDSTEDAALHRLRIHCKKLRYLIEFFRSFFAQDSIDIFLKQMKKLQNNLGDFNDLSVQQDMLSQYQEGLTGRNKKTVMVASSLGGLIAHLSEEHTKVRFKFEKTFAGFSNENNISLFEKTFT